MKSKATCFFAACFVIGFTALAINAWNTYYPEYVPGLPHAEEEHQEKVIAMIQGRVSYKASCIMGERELDAVYGKMLYDCEKIAQQIYAYPDV